MYLKSRTYYLAALLVMLSALAGCVDEQEGISGSEEPLTVRLNLRTGGGMASPTAAGFSDVRLGTIDVLSFDENDMFLYRAAATVIHDGGEYFDANLRKNHAEKTQTLVVLANLRDEIEAFPLTAGLTTKTELQQGLVFGFTHHTDPDDPVPDAGKVFGQQRLLPMWGESEPLVLWADEQNIGTIYLMRAVASVTVTVELEDDPGQKDFELLTAVIYNTPAHGLAIPDPDKIAEGTDGQGLHYLKSLSPTVPANTTHGKAYYFEPTGQAGFVNTIYIGEKKNSATGMEDSDTWLVIGGKYDGGELSWYRLPFIDNNGEVHDVLRNHDYRFKITKVTGPGGGNEWEDDAVSIEAELEVAEWEPRTPNPLNPYVTLNVSAVKASINERNMARIYFSTDQPADSISVLPATPADAIFTGLTDGSQYNLNFDPATGQGYIDIMTDEDAGAVDGGKYTILLKSSGVKRTIDVDVSIVGYPLLEYYDYIGAFWRAREVGERVIVIPNNDERPWSASVEYSDEPGTPTGWVKIAAGKSPDPNYYTDNPGDPEDFPVTRDEGIISGNEHIYFRLGCTGPNSGSAPRYARVKIVWDGTDDPATNQYLYLRQGEQDDYVMRPTDPATTWNGNGFRPLATKFSAYNLTSEQYIDGTKPGGLSFDQHSQIGGSGTNVDAERTYATFTSYPTQSGGYVLFKHATYIRYLIHPSNPFEYGPWSSTGQSYISGTWDEMKDSREMCPKGYRVPDDGPTNEARASRNPPAVEVSEAAQSLWLNPVSGNVTGDLANCSERGYYADGFFDRRPIGHILNSANPNLSRYWNVVSKNDHRIATMGLIMYNPSSWASLFFPMGGSRNTSGLGDIGDSATYMFSQTVDTNAQSALTMLFWENFGYEYVTRSSIAQGAAIQLRCVPE